MYLTCHNFIHIFLKIQHDIFGIFRKLLGLTGHRVGAAVLLGVGVALGHRDDAGLGLVGAQSLPLLHQTVLVPQVVLHVGLRDISKTVYLIKSKLATTSVHLHHLFYVLLYFFYRILSSLFFLGWSSNTIKYQQKKKLSTHEK